MAVSISTSVVNINPLTIPELLVHLSVYVDYTDLLNCIQVSKAWYQAFIPMVWDTIKLTFPLEVWKPKGLEGSPVENVYKEDGNDEAVNFKQKALQKHAHLVRHIIFSHGVGPGHSMVYYPNLLSLRVLRILSSQENIHALLTKLQDQTRNQSHDTLDSLEQPQKQQQQSLLTHLELRDHAHDFMFGAKLDTILLNLMLGFPNLKDLRLYELSIHTAEDMILFMKLCGQLETLVLVKTTLMPLDHPDHPNLNSTVTTALFPKMKKMRITVERRMSAHDQLDWISRCPSLTSLQWSTSRSVEPLPLSKFGQRLTEGTWPLLQDLQLTNVIASDEVWAVVIQGMTHIQKLCIPDAQFGPLSMNALRPHFPHLQYLNITAHKLITGPFIPEILASCPRLEHLEADHVWGEDILEGKPWACTLSLKHLEIYFELPAPPMTSKTKEIQLNIFSRLAQLQNLEVLDVGNREPFWPSARRGTLVFRLENGLGTLAPIRRLRRLHVGMSHDQDMGIDEVQWMIEHWKNLKLLDGKINEHSDVNGDVRATLANAGIQVLPY
ncbi:hypothetical protein BX616_011012 [Lobosporangium transversale]|uniref:F-box domain-containing protein n=1 Tax=Lobosporangium transversale TaxID=64571 RepID=A0A1Y2H4T5_9FUNG|nr:hypothetical protein BCR41DRAFT_344427 [Lobosporangium transversale]KAF9917873.1 hypothetical protein BX616_011012 [Lobosporangium transversale]ORZ29014.1 hypothetical protein BCR41DRAFT_344427 [Lobosporangium transversale]|eukprot:XP_021886687.1 hypothetical protein BCR41DRAFT_344427 [Lobosporangium transversale]